MARKRRGAVLRLCALLLAIAALSCYFLTLKKGYHGDEGSTFALANGDANWYLNTLSYQPGGLQQFCLDHVFTGGFFYSVHNLASIAVDLVQNGAQSEWYTLFQEQYAMSTARTGWMDGAYFQQAVTVTESSPALRLLSVLCNQASDTHPPFYYLCINFVFSLFPGTYSNWYAFSVNLFFLLLACLVLYRTARAHFGGERTALAAVAVYGFSSGFLSTAVFFRMYAVLSFFTIWTLHCHLSLAKADWKLSARTALPLAISTVLGFYTQYYFLIYAVFLSAASAVLMLYGRKYRELLHYCLCMLCAACVSLILWPVSVYHLFYGSRGTQAASNLSSTGFLQRAYAYAGVVADAFFAASKKLALAAAAGICASLAWAAIRARKSGGPLAPRPFARYCLLVFPMAAYWLVIVQISPYQIDRYIMCIYPAMALLIACALAAFCRCLLRRKAAQTALLCTLVAALSAVGLWRSPPNYLYQNAVPITETTDVFSQGPVNCVVIGFNISHSFPELPAYDQIIWLHNPEDRPFILDFDILPLQNALPRNPDAPIILEISTLLDPIAVLTAVCPMLGRQPEDALLIRVGENYSTKDAPMTSDAYLLR